MYKYNLIETVNLLQPTINPSKLPYKYRGIFSSQIFA